jgi:hypothetical protein
MVPRSPTPRPAPDAASGCGRRGLLAGQPAVVMEEENRTAISLHLQQRPDRSHRSHTSWHIITQGNRSCQLEPAGEQAARRFPGPE